MGAVQGGDGNLNIHVAGLNTTLTYGLLEKSYLTDVNTKVTALYKAVVGDHLMQPGDLIQASHLANRVLNQVGRGEGVISRIWDKIFPSIDRTEIRATAKLLLNEVARQEKLPSAVKTCISSVKSYMKLNQPLKAYESIITMKEPSERKTVWLEVLKIEGSSTIVLAALKLNPLNLVATREMTMCIAEAAIADPKNGRCQNLLKACDERIRREIETLTKTPLAPAPTKTPQAPPQAPPQAQAPTQVPISAPAQSLEQVSEVIAERPVTASSPFAEVKELAAFPRAQKILTSLIGNPKEFTLTKEGNIYTLTVPKGAFKRDIPSCKTLGDALCGKGQGLAKLGNKKGSLEFSGTMKFTMSKEKNSKGYLEDTLTIKEKSLSLGASGSVAVIESLRYNDKEEKVAIWFSGQSGHPSIKIPEGREDAFTCLDNLHAGK